MAQADPPRRRYNVLPTTKIEVIQHDREADTLLFKSARWGLIPHWWKDKKLPRFSINARAEEAASKPMWRGPYRNWRCLIPAEGWYEWPEKDGVDPTTGEITEIGQPHFIYQTDREPFCFAGLASMWTPSEGEAPVLTCAILTQAASLSLAPVHDRMPVILPKEWYEAWADPTTTDAEIVTGMIRDYALRDFEHHAVRKLVNTAKNDGPELIEPLREGT